MLFYVLAIIMAAVNIAVLPAAPIVPWLWVFATALVPAAFGLVLIVFVGIVAVVASWASR
jgi:hypothetical protein